LSECYVFRRLESEQWWQALGRLERSLRAGGGDEVAGAYRDLVSALVHGRHPSLAAAAGAALSEGEAVLAAVEPLPAGLAESALADLELIQARVTRDWRSLAQQLTGAPLPPLADLAAENEHGNWVCRLLEEEPEALLGGLVARFRDCGTGLLGRFRAFRWRGGRLEGIARPAPDRLEELIGLERQIDQLTSNVERFLAGSPALHTLLYGPRGSGKSTAVRSLLVRYAASGLRLVEVAPDELGGLTELSEALRSGPHRYLAFVDDLSFEAGDAGYRPLKSLLEGSLSERPANVLLVATSNRRHLVRESFSDRPMPENDDVHAWDTEHERLALADRFGLTITFPSADQRNYLLLVRELARSRGIEADDGRLDVEAIRFADWGNGYSGRTARQFIDTLGR
jgi:predicted AAA+ superfamily ATPase